jgi:DNA replication protein DnaC
MIRARINEEPFEYKDASLDSYAFSEESLKIKPTLDAFANRVNSMSKGLNLFLWSPNNGAGKTYLSYAILRQVREFNQPLWRKEGPELPYGNVKTMAVNFKHFVDLCKTFDEDAKKYQEALYNADYLLIDEVSSNMLSQNPHEDKRQLLVVLDDRLSEFRPTIITSNNSPEEFQNIFGPNIYSRLQSRTEFIEVLGKDMRPILKMVDVDD